LIKLGLYEKIPRIVTDKFLKVNPSEKMPRIIADKCIERVSRLEKFMIEFFSTGVAKEREQNKTDNL